MRPKQLPGLLLRRILGPFDPAGKTLLVHHRRGMPFGLWEVPLDGGPMRALTPPGFRRALHVTRSRTGVVTFDLPRFQTVGIGRRTPESASPPTED